MTPTPKRRWFRFSLRTLFVVVTVFALWLGYNVNWIRQRHAFIDDIPKWSVLQGAWSGLPDAHAPGMLWLFGEDGFTVVTRLTYAPASNAPTPQRILDEMERARRLFPESSVELATFSGGAEPEGGY